MGELSPLVSIIIRTVEREALQAAINSVMAQSYRPIELVVVHDVKCFVAERWPTYEENGVSVRHVHRPAPHGRSWAANLGLSLATGDLGLFLDDDDVLLPGHIEKLVNALQEHPTMIAAYSDIDARDATGKRVKIFDQPWEKGLLRLNNFLPIHAVLFRLPVAKRCFFDVQFTQFEDWDFWLQLSEKGAFIHCPGVSGIYHLSTGDSGLSANRSLKKVFHWHAKIHRKWLVRWGQDAFSEAVFLLHHHLDVNREQKRTFEHLWQTTDREKSALEAEYSALRADHTQLQAEHEALQANHAQLLAEHKQALQKSEALAYRIEKLLDSKSWRLTAPLRGVGRLARKGEQVSRSVYRLATQGGRIAWQNPRLLGVFWRVGRSLGWRQAWRMGQQKIQRLHAPLSEASPSLSDAADIHDLGWYFEHFLTQSFPPVSPKAPYDIVIPVYNGFEFLAPLFDSLLTNTSVPYRLIVVNDASPDERVAPFLADFYQQHHQQVEILLLENEENLGFIGSVNRAMALTQSHSVLLNTDVEVPPFWLERLMWPIENDTTVASTTPMTNAGTICSFPEWLEDNPLYLGYACSEIDKAFRQVDFEKTTLEIPTGVGFCMGINHDLYQRIGMFDPVFGKGYGEENDWCMRAQSEGYRHLMVTNLFVYHKHGGSFESEEKRRLIEENSKVLAQRYPDYFPKVHQLIAENPLAEFRHWMQMWVPFVNSKQTIFMIDHQLGGGTTHYREDKIRRLNREGVAVILWVFNAASQTYWLHFWSEGRCVFSCPAPKELSFLKTLADYLSIERIFVNALVSFPQLERVIQDIVQFKASSGVGLTVALHDYFMLCPSYTLLDYKGGFCGLPEPKTCRTCLRQHPGEFRAFTSEKDIEHWRQMWAPLLHSADELLCFSQASAALLQQAYPFAHAHLHVVPHYVAPLEKVSLKGVKGSRLTLGVLGNINDAKGLAIIEEMLAFIEAQSLAIELVIIGQTQRVLKSEHVRVHGAYQREDLPNLLSSYGVQGCLIPSIWPETFSYTSSEVMMMGLPLFVFDLGAPAERTRLYDQGVVVAPVSAEAMLKAVQDYFASD